MGERLRRLKFRCSEQKKGRENHPVSSVSALSEEQCRSMEQPYEIFTKHETNHFIIAEFTGSWK